MVADSTETHAETPAPRDAPPSLEERLQRFVGALVPREAVAAVAMVGSADRVLGTAQAGELPAGLKSRFDLASLTKPVVATLAVALHGAGRLSLTEPLGAVLPGAAKALAGKTLGDLLRHQAGLLAWLPLYHLSMTPPEAYPLMAGGKAQGAAPGTYSDLGYMLWAQAAEQALSTPLAELVADEVARPLGLAGLEANPGPRDDVVPCPLDTAKEAQLAKGLGLRRVKVYPAPETGTVQDGNARFLGGFPGHAGLFGRAEDLYRLGREWVRPGRLLSQGSVNRSLEGGGTYGVGWERWTPAGPGGPVGAGSFGHTGFTGGSLWLEPRRGQVLVFLAHRRAPFGDFQRHRRRFHEVVLGRA